MKTLLALALLSLAGCASLQPTAIDPTATIVINDLKAVTAAAGGDCTIQITPPGTGSMHTDCAPLDPATTQLGTNESTYKLCFGDATSAQVGGKVSAAAIGLQAQICAQQGKAVTAPVPPMVMPPAKPLGPAAH